MDRRAGADGGAAQPAGSPERDRLAEQAVKYLQRIAQARYFRADFKRLLAETKAP